MVLVLEVVLVRSKMVTRPPLGLLMVQLVTTVAFLGSIVSVLAESRARTGGADLQAASSVEQSLCQSEYLRVKCDADEVVIVTQARYGRMRISRCVKENFGYVGCSIDVLPVLDLHCSGRRTCSVRVLDDNFDNVKPCHDDLKSYLEVKYTCVKVIAPERQYCQALKPVVVSNQTGFLASMTSAETGCGTAEAPWLVQLSPGQRINISLYDFATATPPSSTVSVATAGGASSGADSLNSTSGGAGSEAVDVPSSAVLEDTDSHQARMCRVYAIVREITSSRTATICGGELRHRIAYVTVGHAVEIRVIGGAVGGGTTLSSGGSVSGGGIVGGLGKVPASLMMQQVSFLLRYEAIGCPEVEAPPGGWTRKSAPLEMTIGCTERSETWKLHCRGSEWIGDRRNCTIRAERIEAATEDMVTTLSLPLGFSLVIIVALALLIGLLILAVGVVCLKRLKQQEDYEVDQAEVADIACFAVADGVIGDSGRCGGSVCRTLCQRSVNCAARLKIASSSSTESRDLSPYEAAAVSMFPGELHGRFRSIGGGSGCPASLSASGGPAAAGYACMTLLSPERDCSPEPEARPATGNSHCDENVSRSCCTGTGHYGCRVFGIDRKLGSDRNNSNPASADRIALAPNCGNAVTGNSVTYTCAKHRNMTSFGGGSVVGGDRVGVVDNDGPMTSFQCHGQPIYERHSNERDESTVKVAVEIGDVF